MPEVKATPTATTWVAGLRGPNLAKYEAFLDELAERGCEALDYRLTGEVLERLCVRHIRGPIRAVVAFQPEVEVAWVVLVGEHTNNEKQIYEVLYEITGIRPDAGRTKPPCCGEDGDSPEVDDGIIDLFRKHTRRMPKPSRRR